MSYTYLQVAAVECSPGSCSDTEPSAMSSVNPTAAEPLPNASKTGFSTTHPSIVGLSESLLTAVTLPFIADWLTASARASRALPSVSLENALAGQIRAMAGPKLSTQSESLSPPSPSSKTSPDLSPVRISKRYQQIFTKLGIECVQPSLVESMSEHRTSGSGSGCWPTPTARDFKSGNHKTQAERGRTAGPTLSEAVVQKEKCWPTQQKTESRQGLQIRRDGKKGTQQSLTTAVKLFQSPMPSDVRGGRTTKGKNRPSESGLRKQLFPTPRSEDGQSCGAHKGNPDTLTAYMKLWPSPKASAAGPDYAKQDRSATGISLQTAVALEESIGGTLNPDWVEWLMNWPLGWSSLEPLPKEKYNEWIGKNQGAQNSATHNPPVEMRDVRQVGRGQASSRSQPTTGSDSVMPGVPPQSGCGSHEGGRIEGRNETMGWTEQVEDMPEVRQGIPLQQTETDNVQSVMRQSAGVDEAWWSQEPPGVPRVTVGCENRVDRLEAIGDGQIPAVAATAFRILSGGLVQ